MQARIQQWRTPSRLLALFSGLLVVLAAVVALAGWPAAGMPGPRPVAGNLDLGAWNFARQGSVRLAGQWLYFDRRWVKKDEAGSVGAAEVFVPGPWPAREPGSDDVRRDGYGTYLLHLHLPAAPQGDQFAVDSGQILSAYRILVNGVVVDAPGAPAASASAERADSYSSLAELPQGDREVTLALQVSNHVTRNGGIFTAPVIGLKSELEARRRAADMIGFLVIGALLFTACFHIAFLGVTRAGFADLWFGLLALLFGGRMFFFEPLASLTVPLIGQDWVWRCDVAASVLLLPSGYWFFALSFPDRISRRVGYALSGIVVALALATLAAGPVFGEYALKTSELIGAAIIVYLSQAIFRAAWADEHGAGLALLGWVICAISALHDMLLDNLFIAGPNLLPFGSVAFFLLLSGALTQRSHHAFLRAGLLVDERTSELREKIAELERNRIELERARATAVSANVAKSRFLANMSHELRTPLNAILGFSEIIRDRMFGQDGSRYADYASSIHASGRHLLRLINDILDLSKIEAGKFELVDAPLDLGDQVRVALRLVDQQARRKNVRLTLDNPDPVFVMADERAIRQILINLVSNAVKFTLSGGSVVVSIREERDGSVVFRVRDDGIGIRPEDIHRVFENFGQGRQDIRATEESGTGLGLPIAKGLVEAMGGHIEIESQHGIGTTVSVALPPRRRIARDKQPRAA